MKKYFRLYPYCHLEIGKTTSCLYDISSGKMIKLNKENAELLRLCQENTPIESINMGLDILEELKNMNLGTYYDNPQYIEPFFEINDTRERIFGKNNFLKKMFILTSTYCNMNCRHCNEDTTIFRKTGCKVWSKNVNLNLLTKRHWRKVIEEFLNLHGEEIVFIGGEPLLDFSFIKIIVGIAQEIGISKFSIFTNGSILNNTILNFIVENRMKIYIQVFEIEENGFNRITNSEISPTEIISNIKELNKHNLDLQLNVLITKDNEDNIEKIINKLLLETKAKNIKIEFLYPKPNNKFFSKKYVPLMYDRKKEFSNVNIVKMKFLHQYNPSFFGQITIRRDGKVTPHPMLLTKSIGDVMQDDIFTIINTEEYQKYIYLNKEKITKCSTCAYKYNCMDDRVIESFATDNLYGMEYCCI
ncbi:radical SAM protein [Bacillus paralicheniformis]|uniref:radical SAM protein n=1 Tax=Bacillus paralicheniformis TaxID=1648923 RepID=UPI00128CCB69|nr:radical SAM protein [Bacillus paralicheniformis]MPQ26949.1 radical SAM protein [Bacillus paralicheniformis]